MMLPMHEAFFLAMPMPGSTRKQRIPRCFGICSRREAHHLVLQTLEKCRAPSQVILAGTQAKQMYKPDRVYPHCASLSRCHAETRGLASSTNSVLRFAVLPRAHQSLSELSTLSNKTMAFSESLRRLFSRVRCFCHSSCCRRWPASTSRGKEVVSDT